MPPRDRRIRPQYKPTRQHTFDPRQVYFVNAGGQKFNLWVEEYAPHEGWGPNIHLGATDMLGTHHDIDLTVLTHEEFKLVKHIIERALELVEPVVIARDRRAREMEDETETTFERNYRPVPPLVERSGASELDGEELLQRPVDVSGKTKSY